MHPILSERLCLRRLFVAVVLLLSLCLGIMFYLPSGRAEANDSTSVSVASGAPSVTISSSESMQVTSSNSYTLTVVAQKGDAGITAFGGSDQHEFVSINDEGTIAFIARHYGNADDEDIFIVTANDDIRQVSYSNGQYDYGPGLQLNNKNELVAVEALRSPTLRTILRNWKVDRPGFPAPSIDLAWGKPNPQSWEFPDYNRIFGYPAISNFNHIVFPAINNESTFSLLVAYGPNVRKVFDRAAGVQMRPVVGENGMVAVKLTINNIERILLYNYMDNLRQVHQIAAVGPDFSRLGHPSISDSGQIVTFYGDLTSAGAAKYNNQQAGLTYSNGLTLTLETLSAGPGIFASIETNAGWVLQRVADTEQLSDDLLINNRTGASNIELNRQVATVVYIATKSGKQGIYQSQIEFSRPVSETFNVKMPSAISVLTGTLVIEQGQSIPDLNGAVQSMRLYDSINNMNPPELAFWVSTGSTQAIIRHGFISRIQVVELYPDLLTNTGELTVDTNKLATEGNNRVGIATDGVARVLLRTWVPGPGKVRFCLDGGTVPEDGGLSRRGSWGRNPCIEDDAVKIGASYIGFAIYQAPDEFNRGQDEMKRDREITFKATFRPGTADQLEITQPFRLVRPPLMLIHGVWSDGGTWEGFPIRSDERWKNSETIADYSGTSSAYFHINIREPKKSIEKALQKYRRDRLAVTQVDVIAHSMGGLLTRLHVAQPYYRSPIENYNQGNVNRLITLNSPHAGSQWGNLVERIRTDNPPVCVTSFELAMWTIDKNVTGGAMADLSVGSSALASIGTTDVPAYALVGVGGSEITSAIQIWDAEMDALSSLSGKIFDKVPYLRALLSVIKWYAIICGLPTAIKDIDAIMGGEHDVIVPRISQIGGMPQRSYTVDHQWNSIHTFVTGASSPYETPLTLLLNTSPDSAMYSQFPPPSTVQVPVVSARNEHRQMFADLQSGELTITTPGSSTTVEAGETISVVVSPAPGVQVDSVLLLGPALALVDEEAPFEFNATIPAGILGLYALTAVGAGENMLAEAPPVTLDITTTSTITSLALLSSDLFFLHSGEAQQVYVFGTYDDGVIREISKMAGMTYFSTNPAIATVSADGWVTAVAPGQATIIVRNGAFEEIAQIYVSNENIRPSAHAGSDQVVRQGDTVTLDARQTFDLNDEYTSLLFQWIQVAGPAVSLSNSATDRPSFAADQLGEYLFNVTVTDPAGLNATDTVSVVVEAVTSMQIQVTPVSLTFTASTGANPPPQSFSITNSGPGILNWTASSSATWIGLSATSGTTPATINISVDVGGLAPGTYNGQITVSAAGAGNSPRTIPVTLVVDGGGSGDPVLQVSPSTLNFIANLGGPAPAAQVLTIQNGGAGVLNWIASPSTSWIQLSASSGATPATLMVSVASAGLGEGTHTGQITVINLTDSSVVTIDVVLEIGRPVLQVNPSSLIFNANATTGNPPAQTLTIANSGTGSLNWTAASSASWLSLSPTAGSSPLSVQVVVDIAGLSSGQHSGQITFLADQASGSPRQVNVTLNLTGEDAEPQAVLAIEPTMLHFTAIVGNGNPPSKSLSIRNDGTGTLPWTASSSVSWLNLSATSGMAPTTIQVSVDTAALAVGVHTGQIQISSASAQGSPAIVPISLVVEANSTGNTHHIYLPAVVR